MIKIKGKNFVACEQTSQGGNKYYSFNPKTAERTNIEFSDATEEEIDKSLNKAEASFKKTYGYSEEKKAFFLREVSKQIKNLGSQLIDIADWETALGSKRLENERTRTCSQLEKFADYIKKDTFLDITIEKNIDIKSMKIPIGPVVVFPASNFPFAFGVCGGDSASAWAAGCPVIVKAHPLHPQTSELFAHAVQKAIEKTNFPKGFFSMVHGKNVKISEKLILHPKVKAIAFTGSFEVGRKIFNLASTRQKPIPVYAEMGSTNPVFIVNFNKDTVNNLADSITLGDGQFCTKPGVIFVTEESKDIINQVVKEIKSKKPGFLLDKKILTGLIKRVNQTKKTGNVKLLTGGHRLKNSLGYEYTVFVTDSNTFLNNKNLHLEHFGPVAIFVKCKDISNFLEVIETLEGQLTGTIHMQKNDINRVKPLFEELSKKVGRIIVNGVPTGVKVCNAMIHGGPYPATTAPNSTSVGMKAIDRFLRPIAFQDIPEELLPEEIKGFLKK